jgi:hypothetical protein
MGGILETEHRKSGAQPSDRPVYRTTAPKDSHGRRIEEHEQWHAWGEPDNSSSRGGEKSQTHDKCRRTRTEKASACADGKSLSGSLEPSRRSTSGAVSLTRDPKKITVEKGNQGP